MNPLSVEAKVIAALSALLFAVLLFGGGYGYGWKSRGTKADLETARFEAAMNKKLSDKRDANDLLNKQLEKQRENDQLAVATIMSIKPPRVQLPECPSAGKAGSPTGSVQAQSASGVLPTETEDVLAADRQRTWEIIGEAEGELADCRVSKAWAARQGM